MAIKTVYVSFEADTRKLRGGMKRAERQVSGLSKAFKRLGATIAAALGARVVFNALKSELFDTDRMIKTARAVGATAKEFDRLSFIIERRMGASAGTAGRLFKFLQIRLGDTAKAYDKYFRAAGLDPVRLRGLDPSEQVHEVIAALAGFEDSTKRMGIASRLLGEEVSLEVIKLASAGPEAFADAMRDYDKIATAFNKRGAAGTIEQLSDEVANLELAFKNLRREVLIEAGPDIIKALKAIVDSGVIQWMSKEITGLVKEISGLVDEIKTLSEGLDKGSDDFGKEWRNFKHRWKTEGISMFTGGDSDPIYNLLHAGADKISMPPPAPPGDLSAWTGKLEVEVTTKGDLPANRRISKEFGYELDKRARQAR